MFGDFRSNLLNSGPRDGHEWSKHGPNFILTKSQPGERGYGEYLAISFRCPDMAPKWSKTMARAIFFCSKIYSFGQNGASASILAAASRKVSMESRKGVVVEPKPAQVMLD